MKDGKRTVGTCLHRDWCEDFDRMVAETDESVPDDISVSDAVAAGTLLLMQLPPEERMESIVIARKLRKTERLYRSFVAETPIERVNAVLRKP